MDVICVSPGWCKTSLHRHTSISCLNWPFALLAFAFFGRSKKKGGKSIVLECLKEDKHEGLCYRDGKRLKDLDEFIYSKRDWMEKVWRKSQEILQKANVNSD